MDVILPQPYISINSPISKPPKKYPVLYLLHGLTEDHTAWQRATSIERYASEYDLIIVMPAAARAFYTDMVTGYRYGTFISEELPRIVNTFFPTETDRHHTYLAGTSMGGYGAFKFGLTYPNRYRLVGSLSGALDIVKLATTMVNPEWRAELGWIFGDFSHLPGSQHDLFHLATVLAESGGPCPQFYQGCGTEDYFYSDNTLFRDHALNLGLPLTYEEGPGGHNWVFWDPQIKHFLEILPLEKRKSLDIEPTLGPEMIFESTQRVTPQRESNLN